MTTELIHIRVLYFGEAADIAQKREDEISLLPDTNAQTAFENILNDRPVLRARFNRSLLFAVNLEYVGGEQTLYDGDELAIFPPVSGG
jgi:molybdopterin converting factor subunit 1